MRIGGLLPFTTIDYPGRLAAVVFCQGCPWRCDFCHNTHLLFENGEMKFTWEEVLRCLATRKGLLDAVVFSGGEPTLQEPLSAAIGEVREMGFLAGLHTAGAYPEKFEPLVPLLDWVGMDIKAPFEEYEMVTGVSGSGDKACESANILIRSGIPCEFRTTLHPMMMEDGGNRLMRMAHGLKNMGAKHFVIQKYHPSGEKAPSPSFPFQSVGGVIDSVSALFDSFYIRP